MKTVIVRIPCDECGLSIAVIVMENKGNYPVLCSDCRNGIALGYVRKITKEKSQKD